MTLRTLLSLAHTVAKRSLGTGLTAAGVTSSWTWSTTLLSSVTVAYQYGVAGSFFYAACNSTQIMIFSNLAIVSTLQMSGTEHASDDPPSGRIRTD